MSHFSLPKGKSSTPKAGQKVGQPNPLCLLILMPLCPAFRIFLRTAFKIKSAGQRTDISKISKIDLVLTFYHIVASISNCFIDARSQRN